MRIISARYRFRWALSSFTKVVVLPFIGTLSTRFAMRRMWTPQGIGQRSPSRVRRPGILVVSRAHPRTRAHSVLHPRTPFESPCRALLRALANRDLISEPIKYIEASRNAPIEVSGRRPMRGEVRPAMLGGNRYILHASIIGLSKTPVFFIGLLSAIDLLIIPVFWQRGLNGDLGASG